MIHHIEIAKPGKFAAKADIDVISYSMGGTHTGVYPVFEQVDYKDIKHSNRYISKKPNRHMPGFGISDVHKHQISLSRH